MINKRWRKRKELKMKRKQIILWAMLSIFLVVNTPILANSLQKINQIPSTDIISEEKFNQKELLFQTILDIANNNEIRGVVLKSEMRGSIDRFFVPGMKFSIFTPHILTKKFLNYAYNVGVILSRILNESKVNSIIEKYQVNNKGLQKEITNTINKDNTLNREITQLSNSNCDCQCSLGITAWQFPVICAIFGAIGIFILFFALWLDIGYNLLTIILTLEEIFNCPGT